MYLQTHKLTRQLHILPQRLSKARELVIHARAALEHTMAASVFAKSVARAHVEATMLNLEDAITQGKADDSADATTSLQSALIHLKAANKI
jgi:Small metal-binding protein